MIDFSTISLFFIVGVNILSETFFLKTDFSLKHVPKPAKAVEHNENEC